MTKIDLRGTQLDLDCMLRDHPRQTFVYRPPAEPAPAPAADPTTLTPDLDAILGPSQPLAGRIKLTDVGPDWVDPNLSIGSKSDPKTEISLRDISDIADISKNRQKNEPRDISDIADISKNERRKIEISQISQISPKWDRGVRLNLGTVDVEKTISNDVNDGEKVLLRFGRGSKALIHNVCKALDVSTAEFLRQAIIEMLCRYIE